MITGTGAAGCSTPALRPDEPASPTASGRSVLLAFFSRAGTQLETWLRRIHLL